MNKLQFSAFLKCFSFALLLSLTFSHANAVGNCYGKFMNPVTDVCWSCVFPISIFAQPVDPSGSQVDNNSSPTGACVCQTTVGVPIGFWEPLRQIDVTSKAYCLVGLGGVSVGSGGGALPADTDGYVGKEHQDDVQTAFYQAHYYLNPVMYYTELLLDDACITRKGFDLAYMTEADPSWTDGELANILSPDSFLYGNIAAVAACSADCVAATAGMPISALHWCAGCNGATYPFTGYIPYHFGGVQSSSLIMQRLLAKMHRQGTVLSGYGSAGMCGQYYQPIMDKTQYKYEMTYPIPQTTKIAGQCCQPLGRTTVDWGSGREFPVTGEDFSYLIFRKRDCCEGAQF